MRGLALVSCLALAACASAVPANSDEARFRDEGAIRVAPEDRFDLLVGNTAVGDGFRVYYDPDGTKRIRVGDGEIVRRWRQAPDGRFCEELAASAVEVCADSGRLYEKNGLYRAFRPDGTAAPLSFRVVEGDAG